MCITDILKRFLLPLIAIGFGCCKDKVAEYVYHDKWTITERSILHPLKGKPVEVRGTAYSNLNDTSLNATGQFSFSELNKFDHSGNKVFTRYYIYQTTVIDINYTYKPNGPELHILTYDSLLSKEPRRETNTICEHIRKNEFKITSYVNKKYSHYDIVTFSSDGSVVKEENWKDSVLKRTLTTYYDKDRIKRIEAIQGDEKNNELYYYSDKGFLDSVATFENGNRVASTVYINNELGDPLLYMQIGKDSLEEKLRMKYEYDEKGNWIKRLEFVEKSISNFMNYPPSKFPRYSLTVREIKY